MGPSAADRAARLHRACFGTPAQGVWAAPGRVNLIGEHTDYNGGLALPIALPHRTYAAASRRADHRLRVVSELAAGELVEIGPDEIGPGRPGGWAAYVAGVLWALREAGHQVPGLDLAVCSQVPAGAGLSSSAALECAVGAAASDLAGLGLLDDDAGRTRLAAACVRAENVIAGAPTGGLDQTAALLGRRGHALLLDCRSGAVLPVAVDFDGSGPALLVIDTGARHALVDGQYAARRLTCERAAAALGLAGLWEIGPAGLDAALRRLADPTARSRVRHVVTETDRVARFVAAVGRGDWAQAGDLMVASHRSLREDYQVSCAELDVAVDTALRAGALGARMTGGGFGGCAIALVPAPQVEQVLAAVRRAFADRGWPAPAPWRVVAADGACRVEP